MTVLDPMPIPRSSERPDTSRKTRLLRAIARAGAAVSGPVSGRRWFPLWAIVAHVGRSSGRAYKTPVAIQRAPAGFVIPIPFGEATQWTRNVLAAGGASVRWQGGEHRVGYPRVVEWPDARADFNPFLRALVPAIGIKSFLRVDDVD